MGVTVLQIDPPGRGRLCDSRQTDTKRLPVAVLKLTLVLRLQYQLIQTKTIRLTRRPEPQDKMGTGNIVVCADGCPHT
jgi:hypothetical protein